jgi:hypothetical protein
MHALREGLQAMSPYFLLFLSMWVKFGVMDAHKYLLKEYMFRGKPCCLYWIFVCSFQIYSPIWAKFGLRELYMLLLVICGCRENGPGKTALFLWK